MASQRQMSLEFCMLFLHTIVCLFNSHAANSTFMNVMLSFCLLVCMVASEKCVFLGSKF